MRYKPRVEHGERQRIRKTRNEIRRGRWGEAGRVAASSPRPPTLTPRTRPAGPGPVQPAQPGRVGGAVLRASGAGAPAHRVLRGPQAQGGAVVQHDRALLQVQLRPDCHRERRGITTACPPAPRETQQRRTSPRGLGPATSGSRQMMAETGVPLLEHFFFLLGLRITVVKQVWVWLGEGRFLQETWIFHVRGGGEWRKRGG